MTTSAYVVTSRAGAWVAGRRTTVGATLVLTDDEAEYELREGSIVKSGDPVPPAPSIEPVLATDVLVLRRGAVEREISVADLLNLFRAAGADTAGTLDFSDPSNSGLIPAIGA